MTVIQIWEDLHTERAGYFRAFWCDAPDATIGSPVVGYCSPGGSHRTIREACQEVRRLGHNDDIYRNGRIVDRCPMLRRRHGSALAHAMYGSDKPALDYLAERLPRLMRAMRWCAILSTTEAGAALRDYVCARDGIYDCDLLRYGGGEAVCHFGGPDAVIRAAIRSRAIVRKLAQ